MRKSYEREWDFSIVKSNDYLVLRILKIILEFSLLNFKWDLTWCTGICLFSRLIKFNASTHYSLYVNIFTYTMQILKNDC